MAQLKLKIDEMHNKITDKLLASIDCQGSLIPKDIDYCLGNNELSALKQIKYKSEYIVDNDIVVVHFTFEDENFILVSGDLNTSNYVAYDIEDPFIFAAIAYSNNIKRKKGVLQSEIIDILGVDEKNIVFDRIKKFFPPFSVYKVSPNSDKSNHILHNFVLSLIIENRYHKLEFNPKVTFLLSDILNEVDEDAIPFENLISAYVENSWKFSYLSFYRCIEPFFSIVWVEKMNDIFKNHKIDDDYWKYINSITDLSRKVKSEKDAFYIMIEGLSDKETQNIYSLRNSIVHNKLEEKEKSIKFNNFSEEDWNNYIIAVLSLIKKLYSKHSFEYIRLSNIFER